MGNRQRGSQTISRIAAPASTRFRHLARNRPTRRAAARRLLAAAVAMATVGFTIWGTTTAQEVRDNWESTVEVLVAQHDLEVGSALQANSLRAERRPAALVPEDAMVTPPSPGSVATAAILEGEPLVEARVAGPDDTRTAVPAGRVALDIELTRALGGVGVGDHVDLLTVHTGQLVGIDTDSEAMAMPDATRSAADRAAPQAIAVASDAVVLTVSSIDRSTMLTVAVSDGDLPSAAGATMTGELIVVKRNPDD